MNSSESEPALLGVVTPHEHEFQMITNMEGDLLGIVCSGCESAWRCDPL